MIEGEEEGGGGGISHELLLLGVQPLGWRESSKDLSFLRFGDHQGIGTSSTGLLEEGTLEIMLAGSIQQLGMRNSLILL